MFVYKLSCCIWCTILEFESIIELHGRLHVHVSISIVIHISSLVNQIRTSLFCYDNYTNSHLVYFYLEIIQSTIMLMKMSLPNAIFNLVLCACMINLVLIALFFCFDCFFFFFALIVFLFCCFASFVCIFLIFLFCLFFSCLLFLYTIIIIIFIYAY